MARLRQVTKGAAAGRNQRHDVRHASAEVAGNFHDFRNMFIIDPGNHHDVDLDQNAASSESPDPRQLIFQQDANTGLAGHSLSLPVDMAVYFFADGQVNRIQSDRHMPYSQFHQFFGILRQHQPIGGQAQNQIGIVLPRRY